MEKEYHGQVFISCPSKSIEVGLKVAKELEKSNYQIWYWYRNEPHTKYDVRRYRMKGIKDADIFIALVTDHTISSIGMAIEIDMASAFGIPIIPIIVDQRAQLPDSLSMIQTYDYDYIFDNLSDLINRIKSKYSRVEKPLINTVERVFIAYSHKQFSVAQELSLMLTKRKKPHFWDAKIKAGATWRQTIQKALDDATHVVVIWTPEAAHSDEVEREVSYALAERKVIVPLLSKEIPKLPYHLHGLHYLILPDDLKSIETDLVQAIEQHTQDDDLWE